MSHAGATPLLVTGFEPFGGTADNPSQQVAEALAGSTVAGHPVVAAVLPTTFGGALPALLEHVARLRPALVLCLGQAGGRQAVSIERVAINVVDARIADNAGARPVDIPVVPGGPAAYFSGLPIKALHAALLAAGLPSEVSNSAGTTSATRCSMAWCTPCRNGRGYGAGSCTCPGCPTRVHRACHWAPWCRRCGYCWPRRWPGIRTSRWARGNWTRKLAKS